MKMYYCWKCDERLPFLEEEEWMQIKPVAMKEIEEIQEYRKKYGCDLKIARQNVLPYAAKKFEDLTGFRDMNFDAIFHHRLSCWGKECEICGNLLRTPKANFCASCKEKA